MTLRMGLGILKIKLLNQQGKRSVLDAFLDSFLLTTVASFEISNNENQIIYSENVLISNFVISKTIFPPRTSAPFVVMENSPSPEWLPIPLLWFVIKLMHAKEKHA